MNSREGIRQKKEARTRRTDARARSSSRKCGWIAVTGTPGTGKSAMARLLRPSLPIFEVSELSIELGVGRRTGPRTVEVDVRAMRRAFRSYQRLHPAGIIVGHLAHLLPVVGVIVLRCHPRELMRRLRTTPRDTSERDANVLSEILDVVLVEALEAGVPVWEVDATHRSPAGVARVVRDLYDRRPRANYGGIQWLTDRRVTAQLLRGKP